MATEFEISVNGSTKNLLDAIGVLSSRTINLETVATAKVGDRYVIRFLTGNDDECRSAFLKADLPFSERKVLVLEVQNKPGEWLRAAQRLVEGGVELEGSYLLGQSADRLRFVFGVSDYPKAKEIAGRMAECASG